MSFNTPLDSLFADQSQDGARRISRDQGEEQRQRYQQRKGREQVQDDSSDLLTSLGLATTVAGAGIGGYSAIEGRRKAKDAQAAQARTQREASNQAARAQRQQEQARRVASRSKPNIAAILAGAIGGRQQGLGGTMLTGPNGVDRLGGGGRRV